jgi:hypothetical protein
MFNVQLDFFEPNDEMSLFRKELALIQDSNRRNHKAQFAKLNEALKIILKQQEEIEQLRTMLLKQRK